MVRDRFGMPIANELQDSVAPAYALTNSVDVRS
jgi:hypothetical protein